MRKIAWSIGILGALMLSFILAGTVYSLKGDTAFILFNVIDNLAGGTPLCLDRGNIPEEELNWLYIPTSPSELATSEDYGFLSGELIKAGAVDASSCPIGGIWMNGYATACGMEKTRDAVLLLQNAYDDEILAAGKNTGVPPVMLKQLIRYESQFWPVRTGVYHFGLGHITLIGANNALFWSRELFDDICVSTSQKPCETTYPDASPETQALLAGRLLSLMDTTCANCTYKIEMPKAEQSVGYLAKILMGYCRQTSQIVYNATGRIPGDVMDYATIWKLTLLNYNMGPACVYKAVNAAYQQDSSLPWSQIASNLYGKDCVRGLLYIKNITGDYYNFPPKP